METRKKVRKSDASAHLGHASSIEIEETLFKPRIYLNNFAEFDQLAEAIYTQIGKPTLSLETAWDLFQKMWPPMADRIEL